MTEPSDFEAIDRQIEDLQDRLDRCRQAMILSRAAVLCAAVGFLLVVSVATAYRTPTVIFSAVAVMIGGTVWLGASKSSRDEAEEALRALDATKDRMIDKVAAQNGWRDLTPTVH